MCNNERIVVHNIDNGTEVTVQLPELQTDKKIDLHNNVNIETYHMITSITFSNDGKYLLVCTNRKQLCLYERKDWKLVSNRTLARAASRVRFAPNNDIVVADKAGDAYLFRTGKPNDEGILLLGHLSMLLDILITDDEKYVITTDRDEKIRVSMYPNSYNILSYCLGHAKFVTNISELPHDKNVLVSAAGDGVIILWDYKNGKELLSVNFSDKISENDIEKFNRYLQDYHLEESIEILPVKHLRLSAIDSNTSLVVTSFYSSPLLLVYKIDGASSTSFNMVYLQSIVIESEPIECLLCKENLWILTDNGFKVYRFKGDSFATNDTLNSETRRLSDCWETLKKNTSEQNLFSILYKRRYDNVQEYLERKKTRLGNVLE